MTVVRLVSWHSFGADRNGAWYTLCGRQVPLDAPTAPELPLSERSCESCLRLAAVTVPAVLAAAEATERDPAP